MESKSTGPAKRIPVVTTRRSDAAFRQIVALIYEGTFAPEERLPPERELAEVLKVSRPTLRDALNRLEARGFIDRRTGSGNYVSTALPEAVRSPIEEGLRDKLITLKQIIDVRKPLEVWAAEEAALRRRPEQLQELKEHLAAMKAAGRRKKPADETYFQADIDFHVCIAQMTGNAVYIHLIQFLTDLIGQALAISQEILDSEFAAANNDRHEAVYESIRAGDPRSAGKAMEEHFRFIEDRLTIDASVL